jgi:hypothetical protein
VKMHASIQKIPVPAQCSRLFNYQQNINLHVD